jgi:hypothetical protein
MPTKIMETPPQNEAYSKPTGPSSTLKINAVATLLKGSAEAAEVGSACIMASFL